ncbi:MAG: GPW/gp25 family protein [Candidatus Sulfotelmatobacter sp.]
MLADFLGKGWGFPVHQDEGHRISISRGEESIRESIWIILATAPGERVMRPDFGCGLHHLVFAVNEAATLGQVKKQVRDALVRWEPRIEVLDVDTEVKGRGEVLLINIHYRVRSTNNFFNLVYPFYLAVGD